MIICIGANPAIDRRLQITELRIGEVNRALTVRPAPGGKAAHVAMAARGLGTEVLWVGFLGGGTGAECERGLAALGIAVEVVHTRSPTRVNQEIIDEDGRITEILESGGIVEEDEISNMISVCERLFDYYKTVAQVVLTGSLPPGAAPTFYARLIEAAHARGCFVLLDTSGEALTASLSSSPDLIKPNREEAETALGYAVRDESSALEAARAFIERGARSVALSLGSDGLLWLASPKMEPLILRAPVVTGRSTVGCGDATLAGFAVAGHSQEGMRERAILAVACGAANCLADSPGMIEAQQVSRLASLIKVESLASRYPKELRSTPADGTTQK